MTVALIAVLLVLGWAAVSGRLARWSVTGPMVMVLAGVVLTHGHDPVIAINLDNRIAERIVEVVLALVLFVDATEVPGRVLGREPRIAGRLLGVALPLSLGLAVLAGWLLFGGQTVWVWGLLAVVAVPTDLAPAVAMVRDPRVPVRLREILNVEAGLNDAVVAPLFLFCLAAAEAPDGTPVADALLEAVPALLIAAGVGALVGVLGGRVLGAAHAHGWTAGSALRLGVLALPGLAYVGALELDGNGFVAAFVAGAFFAHTARSLPGDTLHLVEDVGVLLSLAVWFALGQVINQVLDAGVLWEVAVYALAALTAVRMLPVPLALRGTGVSRAEALFLGWAGPRGLASIVFGLLAYISLDGRAQFLVAEVMTVTVALSIVAHGLSAGPIAAWFGRRATVGAADPPA